MISERNSKFSPNLFLYTIEEMLNKCVSSVNKKPFLFIEYVGSSWSKYDASEV